MEVPGIVSAFGFQGLNFPPLPDGIAALCRRELELSSMYVDAAMNGDRKLALQAMLLDPMVTDIDNARAVLAKLAELDPDDRVGSSVIADLALGVTEAGHG